MTALGFLIVVKPANALIVSPSGSADRASVQFTIEPSDWSTISPTESMAPYTFRVGIVAGGEAFGGVETLFEIPNYGETPTFTMSALSQYEGISAPIDVYQANLLDGIFPMPMEGYGVWLLPENGNKYFTITNVAPSEPTSSLIYANVAVASIYSQLWDLMHTSVFVVVGIVSIIFVFWGFKRILGTMR